ncbi:hypothetical protein [Rhizobium sp. S163]|uniref:hypothetical protein n=1 Tax=Rhizobium sp. S163 TaxID=3055039 RepID=UPI0025A9A7F9|nr:hypothetical protein [Rhizobium sp. S163]MDM9645370.1 hypothetical protein [Rhizobium sp. S163]
MKHLTLDELRAVAGIETRAISSMSASERLERWAELLERNPHWRLSTLHQTEFQSANSRDTMRADNSPLSVAFNDPLLRSEGLEGDTYGEAKRSFGLEDAQLHEIICYCHFGASVPAASAAREVRAILSPPPAGLFERLRRVIFR